MILITGGTGFIGKALIRHLVENGYPVRLLIRPSKHTPDLPRGTPLEVAVSSLQEVRSLKVAMAGVDTIYHLASAELRGARGSLLNVDIRGTQAICQAAVQSGIQRIFYLSHLGADRASAFPLLKAKAIAEEFIRRSGLHYTILRTGIIFGKGDHFTMGIARLAQAFPAFFFIPGDGKTLLQPLWIEDLVTCMVWALDISEVIDQTVAIGGPEFLPFQEIVQSILEKARIRRSLVHVPLPYLNLLTIFLENLLPGLPTTSYWLDYLASNRTCSIDTISRVFRLLPSRFTHRLEYLADAKRDLSVLLLLRNAFKP
jgi:uncharacterized protein YbjT (DUF2867 family)